MDTSHKASPTTLRRSLKKRVVQWISLTLLLLLAMLWGTSEFMLKTSLNPTPSTYRDSTAAVDTMLRLYPQIQPWYDSLQANNALRDTAITAEDGATLHGYYLRAPKPTDRVALLVHGYQDAALRMLHIAYLYHHDLGANVLMPDLRYHGKTAGKSIGMGWNDRFDVRQWARTVPKLFELPGNKLVVHGISMGAATTMMLSGTDSLPPIRAFVEDCGYTSAWDIFQSELKKRYHLPAFPIMHATSALSKWRYGWSFREADAENAVRRCRQPMLFIHGGADDFVPTAMVHRVYADKPQPKSLWIAPHSGHADSYRDYPAEYTQRVRTFLSHYW